MVKPIFFNNAPIAIKLAPNAIPGLSKLLIENKPLGTAGSLSLLPDSLKEPFIVMNGDVLTKLDPSHLISFHNENHAKATLCVREHSITVPFGVVQTSDNNLISF